jgi:hypothetical protein
VPPQPPADVQAGEYEDGDDNQAGEHGAPSMTGITGRYRRVSSRVLPSPYIGNRKLAIFFQYWLAVRLRDLGTAGQPRA